MTDIYTKAAAVTVNTTIKQTDAVYLGHGYSTADTTEIDLGRPDVWWKADEGITKSGTEVTAWVDQVASISLTNVTTGLSIDVTSEGPDIVDGDADSNYKPFLSFTSAGKTFLTAAQNAEFDQGTSDFTVIVFIRFDDATRNQALLSKDSSNSEWILKTTSDGKFTSVVAGADAITSTALSDDVWYSLEWSHNGLLNESQMYINGVADGSAATAALDFDDNEAFLVGCRNNSSEQYVDGDIAEILYYNSSRLTAPTRTIVNDYFDEKYRASTKAKVTYFADQAALDATTTVEIADLPIGVVHPISTIRISGGTATNATNIVALYKD
jgi:hypothetical protein